MNKNKISLNKFINRSLISTTSIIIPVIIVLITFLYFSMLYNFSHSLEDGLILTEIQKSNLSELVDKQKSNFMLISISSFLGIISLYLIFIIRLFQKAKKISVLVTQPIKRLSTQTKKFNKNLTENDLIASNIREIDNLNNNFLELARELDTRTEKLVQAELEKNKKVKEAEQYYQTSITDPLTELYNRLKIEEILEYEIQQSDRYKHPLSIIFLDIDNFKNINDTLGHNKGDEVLVDTAEILRNNLRDSDSVGRWGGEEFIIICTNTPLKNAAVLAEKLRTLIESHKFSTQNTQTASFGIAEYDSNDTLKTLVQKADSAMYEAKKTSKNIVMIYYNDLEKNSIN